MKLSLFDFFLPNEYIADSQANPRESAKLLSMSKNGQISDYIISDIIRLLRSDDLLVFNNSKVIPARLHGCRDDVKMEILLHKPCESSSIINQKLANKWRCFARPAKRLKIGNIVSFSNEFSAKIIDKKESGEVVVEFEYDNGKSLNEMLDKYGEMPLPPYIKRDSGATAQDTNNYQTCYAKKEGSVAAPTAGLHFTDDLLAKIKDKGIETAFVTLHVGGGTFLPMKTEDTNDHVMHSEWGEVCEEVAKQVNQAKSEERRVIAVGTTSLRLLESAADKAEKIQPFCRETDIFITPGYKFKIVDALMTNFHLPKSTLFMLVAAFSGLKNIKSAYNHAMDNNYRFYSYGDACLLEKND